MSKAFSLPRHVLAGSGVNRPESELLRSIVMASPANAQLDPEPIPQEWILDGTPAACSKRLARSQDWTSSLVVWECTPGRFRWHYGQDEAMFVVSGEAFLRLENGDERRFGAGDVGFFPAGMTCDWRVSEQIRKVAVLKETVGMPLGFCLKVWKKMLRVVGLLGVLYCRGLGNPDARDRVESASSFGRARRMPRK